MRTARIERKTKETEIAAEVNLDGKGIYSISTGIGFFDHMLEQLSRHSRIDISLNAKGDLHVDEHHTVEDCGIALGQAVAKALGDKRGIGRYAHAYLPMDETLTRTALDISGRPYLIWRVALPTQKIGRHGHRAFPRVFPGLRAKRRDNASHRAALRRKLPSYRRKLLQGPGAGLASAIAIDEKAMGEIPSTKGQLGN